MKAIFLVFGLLNFCFGQTPDTTGVIKIIDNPPILQMRHAPRIKEVPKQSKEPVLKRKIFNYHGNERRETA
jgi:hypothetical protein